MIGKIKEAAKKLEIGIAELFVGFFMIIGLIGYFGHLPADLDWIDHTVAFLMFSYFFYILDITSLLYGKTSKKANILIVISYLLLFFKAVYSYTEVSAYKVLFLKFINVFYDFLSQNLLFVDITTFYAGTIGIFLASIYITRNIEVSHPSFLYALHKKRFKNKVTKFIFIFLALLAFYYLIYNPILEWLEFVLDDPIVLIGIIYFIISIARHHHKFDKKHVIFTLGDLVWGWYNKGISLFHYKKTLPLAISGLLIMHALADLGVFAYSLVFTKENFYFDFLRSEHVPFLKLFLEDAKNIPSPAAISLLIIYLLNALSLIVFLLIPVVVWTSLISQKKLHFNRIYLFFIYSSIAVYMLMPVYTVEPLFDSSLIGVDIVSNKLLGSKSVLDAIFPNEIARIISVSLISTIFGLVVYIISLYPKVKKELYALSIIGGFSFYTIYIFYFFISLLDFYSNGLKYLATPHFLIGATLLIFFILSILFYIWGYIMFLYEVVMEYHKRKWSEPIDEELVIAIQKIKSIKKI